MKTFKKGISLALAATFILGAASTVGAHEHKIITPGGKEVIIKEEPFHGTDLTNGKIFNNPHYNTHGENAFDTHGLHPIHYMLHMGPSKDKRAIKVEANN
ncbi:hypothetical protein [Alkalihalobacterium elongatum]|uniref:hypothetical protein n=1 Tax=Alkalihalobacterium elongatum TaxID=2675466 RepID=UPI001C1F692F|nr:hypothetical protein [Alkalihalobacterium elongatum]